ncbi:ABC transporter permease [Nonomuraea zeae]|uniref:ABC transporter permease n=1 Tax=Nonomuraea zeae TaxID=1642303 RepID=A0A5S4GTC2_9ACTN|nr:ABC transporter permease [Nonomuraea zeae]
MLSEGTLASLTRALTPLLLLGLSGLLCHRVGVFNIALEGFMLAGAFAAVAGSALTGQAYLGVVAAGLSGAVIAAAFAIGVIWRRGDPMVLGIAVNLLVSGLTTYLLWAVFEVRGTFQTPQIRPLPQVAAAASELPVVGPALGTLSLLGVLALAGLPAMRVFLDRTVWGLRLRGVGLDPGAAESLGVDPRRYRFVVITFAGVLGGWAGAQLSLGSVALFTENMSAGRGWVVVLALLLTNGRVGPLVGVLAVFALADAVGIRLQTYGFPVQLSDAAPYLATLAVIVVVGIRRRGRRQLVE